MTQRLRDSHRIELRARVRDHAAANHGVFRYRSGCGALSGLTEGVRRTPVSEPPRGGTRL